MIILKGHLPLLRFNAEAKKEVGDYYKKLNLQEHNHFYFSHRCPEEEVSFVLYVVTLTIGCIGLPLTLASIFAVCLLVRKDHIVPIYIINLLITDFIELCCMIILGQRVELSICQIFNYIHQFSSAVSIIFMVVISLERYLLIACPLWYRYKRNIKTSVIVCVVAWLLPLLYLPIFFLVPHYKEITVACFLILPFPLLIFFLVGTLKALSAARSIPPDEKQRIVAILVLVLLIYTLLFLPRSIFSMSKDFAKYPGFETGSVILVYFSPLADLFLYVFMRKGICDKLLASLCCCKMDHGDLNAPLENAVGTHVDNWCRQAENEEKKDDKV